MSQSWAMEEANAGPRQKPPVMDTRGRECPKAIGLERRWPLCGEGQRGRGPLRAREGACEVADEALTGVGELEGELLRGVSRWGEGA